MTDRILLVRVSIITVQVGTLEQFDEHSYILHSVYISSISILARYLDLFICYRCNWIGWKEGEYHIRSK